MDVRKIPMEKKWIPFQALFRDLFGGTEENKRNLSQNIRQPAPDSNGISP
jgi:hypothetical protein